MLVSFYRSILSEADGSIKASAWLCASMIDASDREKYDIGHTRIEPTASTSVEAPERFTLKIGKAGLEKACVCKFYATWHLEVAQAKLCDAGVKRIGQAKCLKSRLNSRQ